MECILILFCALLYSFHCIKSGPVIDTVFDQYYPITFGSYIRKNVYDNLGNNGYTDKSNDFDAVRKRYEMDNGAAGDSLIYSPVTAKYFKRVFSKSTYPKTATSEMLYEFDSDISTTVSFVPVGDVYVDIGQSSVVGDNHGNIKKRYLTNIVLSEMRTGNNFYKSQRDNVFNGKDNKLYMVNGNGFPELLLEKENEVPLLPSRALREPRHIKLS